MEPKTIQIPIEIREGQIEAERAKSVEVEKLTVEERQMRVDGSRGMALCYDDGLEDDQMHFLNPDEVIEWLLEEIKYTKRDRNHQAVYESHLGYGKVKKTFKTRPIPRLMLGSK